MEKKKVVLPIIILFLLAFAVQAKMVLTAQNIPDFEVTLTPIYNVVLPGQSALYNLTIKNHLEDTEDRFKITIPFGQWIAQTDPLYHGLTGMVVPPLGTGSTLIYFSPKQISYGHYAIEISVASEATKQKITKFANINYQSGDTPYAEYPAAVSIETFLTNKGRFDPRNPAVIDITLNNKNPKNLSELTLIVKSSFIDESRTVSIDPLSSITETFPIHLDPFTKPRSDIVSILVLYDTEMLGGSPINLPVEILGYSEIEKGSTVDKGFLRATDQQTFKNNGNKKIIQEVRLPYSRLTAWFTNLEPEPSVLNQDNQLYYLWDLKIEPKETSTITVTKDYRLLFLIIILILAYIGYRYMTKSALTVKKTAKSIGDTSSSQLRIRIHVKNRTGKTFKNVSIIDPLQKMIEVEQRFDIGTMKPTKILKHEKKGTLVSWELDSFEPYEERIFTYYARSKLCILGEFKLPTTIVKFKQRGRERIAVTGDVLVSD